MDKQQYSQRSPALFVTNRRKEDGIVDIDRSPYVADCFVTRCACNLSRDKNSAHYGKIPGVKKIRSKECNLKLN